MRVEELRFRDAIRSWRPSRRTLGRSGADRALIHAEFVVASSEVVDEGVAGMVMLAVRSGCVDEHRREALHPMKQGDVIDVDAALGEELLGVAIRQTEAEIPADRQHDHLGREPEPRKRGQIEATGRRRRFTTAHSGTAGDPSMQPCL